MTEEKNNLIFLPVILAVFILFLGTITLATALKLSSYGERPVAPSVPESRPQAAESVPRISPVALCQTSLKILVPTLTPTLTPTPTPVTSLFQGRVYYDCRPPGIRGGLSSPVPPWPKWAGAACQSEAIHTNSLPFVVDWGDLRTWHQAVEGGNHRNDHDVCTEIRNIPCGPGSSDCSLTGGFSFTSPVRAVLLGNELQYIFRIKVNVDKLKSMVRDSKSWLVTYAYLADTKAISGLNPQNPPSPYQCAYLNSVGNTVCNKCAANFLAQAVLCNVDSNGNLLNKCGTAYTPSDWAAILVPVRLLPRTGADARAGRDLWIGTRPQ